MTINGINGMNTPIGQMGMNQATDSYSRNIQNQIANAQKQLQDLSSNENMTLEEKMKKRQEIQQQISDLNMQLRQHQIEQRREKQQTKGSSMNDTPGNAGNAGKTKAGNKSNGLSQASMTAMLSADGSIKQAKVQGSVATKMEGRAGILDSEIKLDKNRGCDTQAKEEELAETEQKAQAATSSQLSTLSDASQAMEEAAKAEGKADKTDGKDNKTDNKADKAGSKADKTDNKDASTKNAGKIAANIDSQEEIKFNAESRNIQQADGTTTQKQAAYTSIDIRL